MNKPGLNYFRPLVFVFVAVTAFIVAGRSWLAQQGVNPTVALVGNVIIWAATILSLLILLRGEKTTNPQFFVRSMYASFLFRFFLILAAAFVYIMTAKKEVNKPALMLCAGLYILYAGLEISALMKSLKRKPDA
jgi:hypothetical protein